MLSLAHGLEAYAHLWKLVGSFDPSLSVVFHTPLIQVVRVDID